MQIFYMRVEHLCDDLRCTFFPTSCLGWLLKYDPDCTISVPSILSLVYRSECDLKQFVLLDYKNLT